MKPFLTYLACPYTHPDPAVRQRRYEAANKATVALMRAFKWNVFSPITHSHPLHLLGLDGDWKFWEAMDTQYLEASVRMVILTIPGWTHSTGIRAEKDIADSLSIPIEFMSEPEVVLTTPSPELEKSAFPIEPVPYEETTFRYSGDPREVDTKIPHYAATNWMMPWRILNYKPMTINAK